MKINSVMALDLKLATTEDGLPFLGMGTIKTREDEMHDLLGPDGKMSQDIYGIVIRIKNATSFEDEEKWWKELDNKLEEYVQLRLEFDRIERNK